MGTLQERIADLMTGTGWTVAEVADIAGVTPSAVHQWLGKGSKQIKSLALKPAVKLGMKSGVSPLWLSSGEGSKYPNVIDVAARVVQEPARLPSNVTALDPDSTIARVVDLMRQTDANGRWRCHDAVVETLKAYRNESGRLPKTSGE